MRLRRWRSASRTGRKLSPGTVKAVSTPASTSASTKAAPASMTELSSGDPCGRRCEGKCRRAATKDGATDMTKVGEEFLRHSGAWVDGKVAIKSGQFLKHGSRCQQPGFVVRPAHNLKEIGREHV